MLDFPKKLCYNTSNQSEKEIPYERKNYFYDSWE